MMALKYKMSRPFYLLFYKTIVLRETRGFFGIPNVVIMDFSDKSLRRLTIKNVPSIIKIYTLL